MYIYICENLYYLRSLRRAHSYRVGGTLPAYFATVLAAYHAVVK